MLSASSSSSTEGDKKKKDDSDAKVEKKPEKEDDKEEEEVPLVGGGWGGSSSSKGASKDKKKEKPSPPREIVSFFKPNLTVAMVDDFQAYAKGKIPEQVREFDFFVSLFFFLRRFFSLKKCFKKINQKLKIKQVAPLLAIDDETHTVRIIALWRCLWTRGNLGQREKWREGRSENLVLCPLFFLNLVFSLFFSFIQTFFLKTRSTIRRCGSTTSGSCARISFSSMRRSMVRFFMSCFFFLFV